MEVFSRTHKNTFPRASLPSSFMAAFGLGDEKEATWKLTCLFTDFILKSMGCIICLLALF